MDDIISEAKAEYSRAKARMTTVFTATPDDKLNWSPSPTARTPLQIVAHAALGTSGIAGILQGKPFPFANMQELDTASRKMELDYTTREACVELLEKTSSDFLAYLDSLTPEALASQVKFPFGEVPLVAAITFPADHLRGHTCQLDYVQTIWGDHTMRM
jgi:hypothetical protein